MHRLLFKDNFRFGCRRRHAQRPLASQVSDDFIAHIRLILNHQNYHCRIFLSGNRRQRHYEQTNLFTASEQVKFPPKWSFSG